MSAAVAQTATQADTSSQRTSKKGTTKAGAGSEVVVSGMAEQLAAQKDELKGKIRAQKDATRLQEWETRTHERNSAYVVGSVRPATNSDRAQLTHVHGWVCEIRCGTCGTQRTINKQDAFQVRFCTEHKKDASRVANKAKRATARVSDPVKLEADIAKLQSELAKLAN